MRCLMASKPSVSQPSTSYASSPRVSAARSWRCSSVVSQKRASHARQRTCLAVTGSAVVAAPAITVTPAALKNLKRLREDAGDETLLLRMGVKSGGCSGMSYHMDFEKEENVLPEDTVMEYEDGFKLVCDPKSLLYLFGMHLDYSSALIGGGFQFQNPNAANSCGCGKSFGV